MAAFGGMTVVVEVAPRSGSLATAVLAAELRERFAPAEIAGLMQSQGHSSISIAHRLSAGRDVVYCLTGRFRRPLPSPRLRLLGARDGSGVDTMLAKIRE